MSDSLTTKAIRKVSSLCGDGLKSLGFSRRVPHFFRPSNDLFHCIHFQASQWGTRDAGSFTINLAVTSATLYRHWTGRPLPANPATALWPIQTRLGVVCPEAKEVWWDISAQTDIPLVAAEIFHRLHTNALPFFDRYVSSSDILDVVQIGTRMPGLTAVQSLLLRAMLLTDMHRLDEAAACIAEALSDKRFRRFRSSILTIANRLNLPFDDASVV